MYTVLVIVLILGVVLALGLMVWILMRSAAGPRDPLMGSRPEEFEAARARGYDEAAARRIAARGGDDRYEMPGPPSPPLPTVTSPDSGFVDLTDELRAELLALLDRGRKIEAIKIARERTGLGLKESKDLVEGLRPDDGLVR